MSRGTQVRGILQVRIESGPRDWKCQDSGGPLCVSHLAYSLNSSELPAFPFFLVHIAENSQPIASEFLDPSTFDIPSREKRISLFQVSMSGREADWLSLVRHLHQVQSAMARGGFIYNLSPKVWSPDQPHQSPWGFVQNGACWASPNLLDLNLHVCKLPRSLVCTARFEKLCCRSSLAPWLSLWARGGQGCFELNKMARNLSTSVAKMLSSGSFFWWETLVRKSIYRGEWLMRRSWYRRNVPITVIFLSNCLILSSLPFGCGRLLIRVFWSQTRFGSACTPG